jgi:hypothetical protein
MLKERYVDIRKIISTTAEFFNVSCQVPENMPNDWLKADGNRMIVKLNEIYLIFCPFLQRGIKVELESSIDFTEKEKWQLKMEDLKLEDFSFSTIGVVFHSDTIFDLVTPHTLTEEILQKGKIGKDAEKPVLAKPKKCPNCGHKVSEKEIDDGSCDKCGENFWICPRCDALIDEDPDDNTEKCPICEKTFAKVICPSCKKDIWVDESKCPECGEDLKTSKCPGCDKRFIVSDDLEECPYCGETIYICPRCNEYLDEDPDDIVLCPLCEKSLSEVNCPKCHREIFSDAKKCEHCGKEFKLAQCPYNDCEKPLIPSEDIDECPHCQNSIKYIKCPSCKEEFYIEGD